MNIEDAGIACGCLKDSILSGVPIKAEYKKKTEFQFARIFVINSSTDLESNHDIQVEVCGAQYRYGSFSCISSRPCSVGVNSGYDVDMRSLSCSPTQRSWDCVTTHRKWETRR